MIPARRSALRSPSATWLLERCRSDLQRDQAHLPEGHNWAATLLRQTCTSNVLDALERRTRDILERSEAVVVGGEPPVRLGRLARELGVVLKVADSRVATPSFRGSVAPNSLGGWIVHYSARRGPADRETVAHEFGHILLYPADTVGGRDGWCRSRWSVDEEAIANYAARLILVPSNAMPTLAKNENIAAFVATRVAKEFRVPLRLAALRLLDLTSSEGPRAAVFWRQYAPFEPAFLKSVARRDPQMLTRLLEIGRMCREQWPTISYQRATVVWRLILDAPIGGSPTAELQREAGLDRFKEKAERSLDGISKARRSALMSRITAPSPFCYRPEWVVWRGRPQSSFVPLRRGSAKAGSLVAGVLSRRAFSAAQGREAVTLGDLRGSFDVHACAFGDNEKGTRCALVTLGD